MPLKNHGIELPKSIEEKKALYLRMMHGLQSSIAALMSFDLALGEKKHLRVGVDSALIQSSALARLLIEKDLITEEEFWDSTLIVLAEDLTKNRERFAKEMGVPVDQVNFR